MSYQSYEVGPLFLKDCKNICSICEICDSAKVRGFIRWEGSAAENAGNYFSMKELLETQYGLTLRVQCYVDKDDVVKCVADKVMHYMNGVRFVVGVVMS
jgi:hypothetical protein